MTENIKSLADWSNLIDKFGFSVVIKNEYGDVLTKSELFEIITRDKNYVTLNSVDSYSECEGLCRNDIDGRHCVGHGEGPWDLITGEFS